MGWGLPGRLGGHPDPGRPCQEGQFQADWLMPKRARDAGWRFYSSWVADSMPGAAGTRGGAPATLWAQLFPLRHPSTFLFHGEKVNSGPFTTSQALST